MGDKGNNGRGNANGGDVPMYSRKIIQSLKEIVNCSDFEIYTMLVECDMDPNETVNRLISLGTFQEVKCKRNKRKETKNLDDFWSKPVLGGINKYNSNEMGSSQVVVNRRRNGPHYHSPGSSNSSVLECQTQPNSVEIKKVPTASSDATTSSSLPSLTHQSAWASANLGKRTMVDIVKMGRPLQQKNVVLPHLLETQESGSKVHVHDESPSVEKKDVYDDEEKQDPLPRDNKLEVIIPSHLHVDTSERSHILFGSFGSEIIDDQAIGLNISLEETLESEDDPSFIHPNIDSNGEEEEQLTNVGTDEKTSNQIDSTPQDSSDANLEEVQHEPPQEDHQYMHWYTEDYRFENNQVFNPPSKTNHQMQMLDMFPNILQQGNTSSLPNILLPSGILDARDSNLYYSPFPIQYNTIASSSLSDPTIAMAEALRVASISPQNSEQQHGLPFAQHLTLNPYAHQLRLPLGPYDGLMTYPYMQHGFNLYNPLNLNNATNSYEDVLMNLQFQERIHLGSPQHQNDNSVVWHQRQQPNSLGVPGSGYYNFAGHQYPQPPDFYHVQQLQQQHQPSQQQQHFGGYGYDNLYHLQAAMSLEHLHHQEENACDASEQTQE